jgi:hypothetical protein
MKPSSVFSLVVRLLGLIFLYQGLAAVPLAVSAFCPRFPHFIWSNFLPALLMVGWPLVVAFWLVRGAPPLIRLAYPQDAGDSEDRPPEA